jgi:RimJ/RimL family protein N-acetyltransferase
VQACLTTHTVHLQDGELLLRPTTEQDWGFLVALWNTPEVAYYTEGGEWTPFTLEDVQRIYAGISAQAYCFIMEVDGRPIGECWLQRMNLPRLRDAFPHCDQRRIDLAIADPDLWGHGCGTRAIRLLADFALTQEKADAVFACDVWDYNTRSLRAFKKAGFQVAGSIHQPPGAKGRATYDLARFRAATT